ncbi:hypothetical protein OIU77_020910 [Salix suchowensis]|uniref:Uncharacterized protein n=1 Tax=Salix suchowensis TaxID=1278906 RepID=A0ABQ9C9T9_9ROSI|nr:hypothetical protein OIU77_020910 [Salix suchowensis]
MADSSDLSIKKAKEKGSKQEAEEVASPWRNLQLILSIQNREIHLQKKVELAYDFVNSREKGGGKDADVDRETVKVSRVVAFLNDWFCLEESLRLQVSLSFSRNLLRAIGIVARNVLSVLTAPSVRLKESVFTGAGLGLHSVVLDCVSLVFLSHGGLSNENLDLWILSILPVLEFVSKVYDEKLEGGNVRSFALRFSCLVLEPFAKFLRVHPTRKNGFRDFVDKLLEPLLHLLGVLHLQSDASNPAVGQETCWFLLKRFTNTRDLNFISKELLASVRHLLDIEYEVIENDLTRLWFIMLSCLAFGHSYKDAPNACSLTSQILGLGCQLVKLYSELRQVKSTILRSVKQQGS